ncbi:hypothetical protein [Nesterenkonia alba]|uniref:hypothetical protein n=1 Tax=Nesterenkonia alba TaxID=515814 RepID=UPI0003B66AAC|nr:hypothetical protein [Nesterenkonia alba]
MVAAAAVSQLEQAAAEYQRVAELLHQVQALRDDFLTHADQAAVENWQSAAAALFRLLAMGLRWPANLLAAEAENLAGEAATISAELQQTRDTIAQLAWMVEVAGTIDLPGVLGDTVRARVAEEAATHAAEVLHDAQTATEYLTRQPGGIPEVLREVVSRAGW